MYTWDDLAGLALARQFPDVGGRDIDAVAEALQLIGPIQAQTARSPFLGLAARMPGVRVETISAAYDEHRIVRGSNIRGTVHTSTPEDNPLLEVATRLGQRTLWQRQFKLEQTTLEDLWAGIEDYARDEWRTPAELRPRQDLGPPTRSRRRRTARHRGRALLRLRPRRPDPSSAEGRLAGPGSTGLPSCGGRIGDRQAILDDPDGSIDSLVRRHISCHGPSSRQDLAWWAGAGLRVVDASLERLADQVHDDTGPDGRTYHDLAGRPAAPTARGRPAAARVRRRVLRLRAESASTSRDARAPRTALDPEQRADPGTAARRREGHGAVAPVGERPEASVRGDLVRRHASTHQGRARRSGERGRGGVRRHRDGSHRHPRLSRLSRRHRAAGCRSARARPRPRGSCSRAPAREQ